MFMLRSLGWTPVDPSGTGPPGQPARVSVPAERRTRRGERLQRQPTGELRRVALRIDPRVRGGRAQERRITELRIDAVVGDHGYLGLDIVELCVGPARQRAGDFGQRGGIDPVGLARSGKRCRQFGSDRCHVYV
jgi:hypothetical protein